MVDDEFDACAGTIDFVAVYGAVFGGAFEVCIVAYSVVYGASIVCA